MSETNRLLSDSTPEKKIVSSKVADQTKPVKTSSAWNVDETELQSVVTGGPPESQMESLESTFISDVSPAHSRGSDKELLRAHKTAELSKNGNGSPKLRSSGISPMRSTTPRSMDGRTQRDRIKERIAAAKERVQATTQVKPKPLPKKGKPAAQDDTVSKEDEEVEEAMKRHKIMRSRWKVASAGIHVAGLQSSLDFFSRSLEERGQSPPQIVAFGAKSPTEGASPKSGVSEEEKLLCAEVLGSKEDDWLPLFSYEAPQPEDWDQLKQKQIGLFFCPSASPVPIEEKLEPDTAPRFIEEEGLYVGKKANIPSKRRNKLEQRIMAMGSERLWFGEDGEIKGIQDPLDFRRFREYKNDVIDYELIEYIPPQVTEGRKGDNSTTLGGSYILELDIGAVSFKHHPLFSKEEVLGSRLASLVYTLSARSTLVRRLAGRLTALRNFPSHGDAKRHKIELKDVRTAWLKEAKNERELLGSILETWRDMKALRTSQGFTVTSYRLVIIAREDPEHGRGWQREYDFYLQELEDEAEIEYRIQMEAYQKRVDEWNERRHRAEELDPGMTTTDEDEPDKPQRETRQRLKQKVADDLGASLRPPEEPLVEVELKTDGTITTTVDNNAQEQERRLVAAKTQLWIALRHNDKEVDRVKTLQEPHFVYRASYRFCLRLCKWPKSLALRLLEVGQPNLFGRKPIAEVFVPVPGRLNTDSADWQDYEFSSSSTTGQLTHAGVGTDVNSLCTGLISVRAGWALPLPQIVHVERPLKENKSGKDNIKALKEWAEQVQLDPNDPTNADLLEYIKLCEEREMLKKGAGEGGKGKSKENLLEFCSEEELLSNPRLKLLMLRAAGQPEFRNMRNIPLNEREIPKDIFKLYEKRTGGKERKKSKGYYFDNIREAGRDFLDNAREEVFKACTQNHVRTFKEIIHEDPIPDLRTLGLTVMRWLQPKRPLRPRRKERKKLPVKGLVGQQLEIMVNIGRAFEVPVRKEAPTAPTASADEFSLVPVRPFIEVTFQDQRRRTTTADGPNPTWNQDIHIPVQCMGGIQNVRDSLFIHLYDEKVVDLVEDERMRETTIVQRTERYWLGSLRIPFTALYSRIEGTFQLYSPPVLLGYKRESKDFRDSTFLTLFVMVHPPLTAPSPLQEKMATIEDGFIEIHLEQWMVEVTKAFPNRRIPALVLNSEGKTVSVTRFIRPIPPPELVAGEKTTPEMVARFVSLIPVVPNYQFFPGQMDIWLNAQEILERCASEIPCRAAMLACLLKYFFERTYILIGTGVPGGPSAFVMTFPAAGAKGGPPTIWDPSTSRKHIPGDPFSPLSSLHAIIDHTNIWVNLQKEELISQMNLDVTKRSSDWWPAFNRAVAAPTPSVQPEALEMKETSDTEVKLLQERLEKILRNAIMKLRSTNRTIWNRYCTASLRKLLPGLETNTWTAMTNSPPDHLQELEHISSSYKMCGFPINQPYSGPSALVEAVKSTGVHLNDAPEMEFSAAVFVRAFPCNILSVWIYVASLVRIR
uniref:Coiled-coil and C2 domain-containing protein 2A n=3 Tax=Lygus hesperus TaxID=30085 RepID=A0A146LPJ8_LYGHE